MVVENGTVVRRRLLSDRYWLRIHSRFNMRLEQVAGRLLFKQKLHDIAALVCCVVVGQLRRLLNSAPGVIDAT